MKELKINISGTAAAGKTSAAVIIEQALLKAGFKVTPFRNGEDDASKRRWIFGGEGEPTEGIFSEIEVSINEIHLPFSRARNMRIFVFGSNEAGIHGAGAAASALASHGAVWGQGWGLQGSSFGIPTKDHSIQSLPIQQIAEYITEFVMYAQEHPEMEFDVTRIGCGLAGFTNEQIAPLFAGAPSNCFFPPEWSAWYPQSHTLVFHDPYLRLVK